MKKKMEATMEGVGFLFKDLGCRVSKAGSGASELGSIRLESINPKLWDPCSNHHPGDAHSLNPKTLKPYGLGFRV